MKTPVRLPAGSRRVFTAGCAAMLIASVSGLAQVAPSAAPSPAALARYDLNKNGRLDPEEQSAFDADQRRAASAATTAAPGESRPADEIIALTPFEVISDTKGYYASNTMSGTRFNSKLEDLASSITVMTKEQMSDFAMLDINDVFLYTAGTEGTGTYTDFTIDRNGSVSENVSLNPTQANRVRGIGSANVSLANFETMGRTPRSSTTPTRASPQVRTPSATTAWSATSPSRRRASTSPTSTTAPTATAPTPRLPATASRTGSRTAGPRGIPSPK